MPKVLISDSLDSIASEILTKNNISVDTKTNLSTEELKKIIDNYDGLIIRSATKVRKDIIDSLSNLKIIGRAGAGVDNVDVEAAINKNIIVMNTPGGNTNATAEHTIALIFALQRKIIVANETTHNGLWEKKKLKGNEIKGKKIGIVGFGNVGKRVAEISNALGMHVSIFSSYFETIKDSFPEYNSCSIDEIVKGSDIISFHCKPNNDGSSIMNKNHLSLMKKNCIIINTARGNLVDEDDLKNALEKKEIKGAALDVFKNEPLEESGFYNLDNIILTPHIAASTDEAQIKVAEMVANQFVEFFNNKKIINSVT
ncbi:hydroxyacid dehydrogenase [Pelagibacteraceae bacterium]|nr:hydroxyacid dehydrogenase [Pelagibacteraceae bacterium]